MTTHYAIKDEETAEASAGVLGGGTIIEASTADAPEDACELKEKVDASHDGESASSNSSITGEPMAPAEQTEDPEKLARIPSGPAYSTFSKKQKQFIVFAVAFAGFFSPLSANIYFPALNSISRDLDVSRELVNLTLTSYMIFQGLAPTVFGDLADMAGRRPAYIIGFVIYIAACIGIALQTSYPALFILRCLQSTGSSSTIALANGVVADVATSAERGTWMGWAQAGPMIGPAIGPVIGGLLAQFLGWRSIFWFLTILVVVYLVPFLIIFPETGRNVVGNGSIPPQGWNLSLINYLECRKAAKAEDELTRTMSRELNRQAQAELAKKRKLRWPNPLNTLKVIGQKDVGLLLLYNALVYTAFYCVASSAPFLFEEIYGFNDLQIGLSFLPFGFGCLLAPIIGGKLQDWNYRRVAKQVGMPIDRKRGDDLRHFPLERARIEVAVPLLVVGDAALICYGWVLEVNASLAAPSVLHFVMGLTLTGAFNMMSVMLVDLYPLSPSTATAANNLVRCLMGAAGTAVIIQMIRAMGRGWCFTFVAAVVAAASPILWVLVRWGPRWREERRVKLEEKGGRVGR
ncbi:hypothetical protein W97_05339 [Coniosporium apollinis CBS 100218]|uniref:Major facilitator superfamily (MFS) profile domain-containing protein n=1 Tax=Coniosporium apollinis (strain CBS 100218) TaxID=1168221 RepID=R7YWT4_CONA1|nr:uncharacterized protein W97_05339 [Coniosporium apollinis CBS 100218]EON66096.1 hypothetical protein W97_05339 [Coniosporium apollinis CBS 100218]